MRHGPPHHHHAPTHLKHAQVHRSKAAAARHYKHVSKHSKRYARLRQSKRHHVARATVPSASSPVERSAASLPPGLAAVKQALELVRLHKAARSDRACDIVRRSSSAEAP